MNASIPLLLLIACLLILLGVIGITAIVLVSKRCSYRLNNKPTKAKEQENDIDPWIEAGRRIDNGANELH